MDLRTLFTAFAGALGGTATALAIGGFLGKTLVEGWFKKVYKAWEIELEKKYKEDFKRFESTLDTIASRDEAKFAYLHPERANAAKEIYTACKNLVGAFDFYITTEMLNKDDTSAELRVEQHKSKEAVRECLTQAYKAYAENSLCFNDSTHKLISALISPIARYTNMPSSRDGLKLVDIENQTRDSLGKLQQHFRDLLGVTQE